MQDCSRIFCEVSISNLHHYDIYLVLAASEGDYDPQSSQRLTPENPAKKTGTSGLRQIQREPNPLARPWKSHRVTECHQVFWCFWVEPGAGARCGWSRKQADQLVKPLQLCCFSHDFLGTCSPLPGLRQPA